MRRAQIDPDRNAPLMRIGRAAGFGNLQTEPWSLLSQRFETAIEVGLETIDEHQRPHLLRGRGEIVLLIERALQLDQRVLAVSHDLVVECLDLCQRKVASSSDSRQAICCIRNAPGIAVLFSASIGAPFSSHR